MQPEQSEQGRAGGGLRAALSDHRRTIWPVVLSVAILGQTAFLLRDYVLPWGWRAKQVLDQPRLVRSADMSLGVQATRAIQFIDQVVPQEAVILLPPEGAPGRFALERSMQYFFFPRRLIECGSAESERCSQALASPEVYILATEDFPAQSDAQGREFLPEPGTGLDWFAGIYGPSFDQPSATQPARQPAVPVAALENLGLVVALSVLGAAVLLSLRRPWPAPEALCLAFPLGAGILTWVLFLLSWAGITISLLSVGAAYLLLMAAFATLARRTRPLGRAIDWSMSELRGSAPRLLLAGAAIGVLCLALGLALGISYRLYDPVQIWSVKGYGISLEGTVRAAETWGVHGLSYPLNLPLQVALFHLLDGDLLPGSKLLYPIYGLSLCLVLFTFLRRQRVDWLAAALGSLLLGTVPIVFFHSVEGFANLHFTFYLTAGILWGVQGVHSRSVREQWLAGLLLGLAAWTRPEGIVYSLGALAVFVLAARITKQGRVSIAALGLPVVLLAGAWFVFSLSGGHMRGSNLDQAVSVAASEVGAGDIDLGGLWTILRVFGRSAFVPYRAMFPATSATMWGALFPVLLLLLLPRLGRFRPSLDPQRFTLLLQWLFVAGTNVAVFYVRSYSKPNFTAFIERAFPRAFLPTAVLMTVLAFWLLNSKDSGESTSS
ncbi:MAG TPA: hypothetical protein VI410_05915 [Anaerolineales bacterium]|nr:hypothetical protein [Anaerolineales bacterium]